MWKIFFNYKDKSRCTVRGKGTITPELAVLQGEGEWEMLNIIQNDFKTSETTFLDEDKVNLVVESVIETIKKGLPEEAQTVEALEFITDRIKERVKEKRIEL